MKKRKLDWKEVGQFFAVLLNVFTIIRDTFKKMGVGIEIIPWLADDGKKIFVEKFLKPLGEEWLKEQKAAVKVVKEMKNEFVRLISGGEELVLDECDGSETLAEASDLFAFRDLDLKNWETNKKGQATGKTPVQVYEMGKDGMFSQLFSFPDSDVRKLCFSQHQIKNFVRKYRDRLRKDGYATFFLFEENNELFVADVYFHDDGRLDVHVDRFEYTLVWRADYRLRLVFPQLAA